MLWTIYVLALRISVICPVLAGNFARPSLETARDRPSNARVSKLQCSNLTIVWVTETPTDIAGLNMSFCDLSNESQVGFENPLLSLSLLRFPFTYTRLHLLNILKEKPLIQTNPLT